MNVGLRFILLLFVPIHFSLSQCSDAGACSIGHRPAANLKHSVFVSYLYGSSGKPDDLSFHRVDVVADVAIAADSRLSLNVAFNSQSGPLGSASGIGDVVVLWTQSMLDVSGVLMSLQGGIKFPTGSVNAAGLPQSYQPGLGTTDLILGVLAQTGRWGFAAAYQIAGGRSNNTLTRLGRGDDILGKAGYTTQLEQLSLTLEVIIIKRLQESTILTSPAGQPEAYGRIPGSDQTQINLAARFAHPLNESLGLSGFVAIPTLKRNINTDGLKRSIAASVGLSVSL
jgi:hypothetical protein